MGRSQIIHFLRMDGNCRAAKKKHEVKETNENPESTMVMKKYQENSDKTEPPSINHYLLTSKENK